MSLWDNLEKYCKAGQATDGAYALYEGYLRQQTHTHTHTHTNTNTVCNIYCFSIATMVAWTHLIVYVIPTLLLLLSAQFICSAKGAHVFIYNFSKTDRCTRTGLRYYEIIAAVFIIKTYWNLKFFVFFHRVFFTQYAYCPRWWLHLIVVTRVEYASDPESYRFRGGFGPVVRQNTEWMNAYCVVIPFWKVLLSTVMHFATFMCTCWSTRLYKLWHDWTVTSFIRWFGYLLSYQ
jgi:hypothetical protein